MGSHAPPKNSCHGPLASTSHEPPGDTIGRFQPSHQSECAIPGCSATLREHRSDGDPYACGRRFNGSLSPRGKRGSRHGPVPGNLPGTPPCRYRSVVKQRHREHDPAHEGEPQAPHLHRRGRSKHGRQPDGQEFHHNACGDESMSIPGVHAHRDAGRVPDGIGSIQTIVSQTL